MPLAPVGAVLPGDFTIARRKMRGRLDDMLCSGAELGLSDDGAGLLVLGDDVVAEPGTPWPKHSVLSPTRSLTSRSRATVPTRGASAGSLVTWRPGLAWSLLCPNLGHPVPSGQAVETLVLARVDAPELCPRLRVAVVGNLTIGPSPDWLARRLTLAGMRPINNVVDASNYVMLERGQPTHPYDLDQLGGRGIVVRTARPGESVTTLDG